MDSLKCVDSWPADEVLLNLQHVLDVLTAIAYFAFPLQLSYVFWKSPTFPHKWMLIYFGAVSILCGANNITNLWMYSQSSTTTAWVITIVKGGTAAILWSTVVVMVFVTHKLLTLRQTECFLKKKVEGLSNNLSLMCRQVENLKSLLKLILQIQTTLKRECIIDSAIVGIGQIFNLKECALWFPSQTGLTMRLSEAVDSSIPIGSTVPTSLPEVAEICSSVKPVKIPQTCPLVWQSSMDRTCMASEVVAVRVPLPGVRTSDSDNNPAMSCAVMVLALPLQHIREIVTKANVTSNLNRYIRDQM